MPKRLLFFVVMVMALSLALTTVEAQTAGNKAPEIKDLILATTTSTVDTGLLDFLIPIFEKQTG
jgi:tungstate transport system substrate-binding protein